MFAVTSRIGSLIVSIYCMYVYKQGQMQGMGGAGADPGDGGGGPMPHNEAATKQPGVIPSF